MVGHRVNSVKAVLALLVVCFSASPLTVAHSASQSFQASAVWGSVQSPLLAAPGSADLPLYVTVFNMGPGDVYSLSVTLNATLPLVPVAGEPANLTQSVSALPAGSSTFLLGYYNVSSSAAQGLYNETLTLSYSDLSGQRTQAINVSVPVLGRAQVRLSAYSYSPFAISPRSGAASLTVYLVNPGNTPATDVNASLQPSYPASVAPGTASSYFVGYLPVGTPVPLTFVLDVANTSRAVNATLSLSVSFNSDSHAVFSIPFVEQGSASFQVDSVSSPVIRVGDGAVAVTLTVSNSGGAVAQYAMFTMLPSNVFQPSVPSGENPLLALSAMNVSVGTLRPGDASRVTYIIEVSQGIPPGTYSLPLLVSWRQQGFSTPFLQEVTVQVIVSPTVTQSILAPLEAAVGGFAMLALLSVVLLLVIAATVVLAARSRRRRKAAQAQ